MSYDIDPSTGMLMPEYCDVFGIPFEVIPVQGAKTVGPSRDPRPRHSSRRSTSASNSRSNSRGSRDTCATSSRASDAT